MLKHYWSSKKRKSLLWRLALMQKKRAILQRLSRNSTKNTWITFNNLTELFWIRYVSDFPAKGIKLLEGKFVFFRDGFPRQRVIKSWINQRRVWWGIGSCRQDSYIPAMYSTCFECVLDYYLYWVLALMLMKTSCLFHHICSSVLLCLK